MAELDRPRIAAAALRVADERGASGFTMRAVAEALGVTPMALYHHVADKAGLVALAVDAAICESPLPPPTGFWQDDLWEVARWVRDNSRAHPAIGRLRMTHQVWTPSIFPMSERWVSVWQQSGLPLDQALTAASVSSIAVIGLVEAEAGLEHLDPPPAEMLAMMPNARLLFCVARDREAGFELAVRSLIEGLHARLTVSPDG